MFFRRKIERRPSAQEILDALRSLGFEITGPVEGRFEVRRGGCAATLERIAPDELRPVRSGLMAGAEIASLVDGGYQKFWLTPSGVRRPALAAELKTLHEFEEDLKEALGLKSLYNESLGTVCRYHSYDRLEGRP